MGATTSLLASLATIRDPSRRRLLRSVLPATRRLTLLTTESTRLLPLRMASTRSLLLLRMVSVLLFAMATDLYRLITTMSLLLLLARLPTRLSTSSLLRRRLLLLTMATTALPLPNMAIIPRPRPTASLRSIATTVVPTMAPMMEDLATTSSLCTLPLWSLTRTSAPFPLIMKATRLLIIMDTAHTVPTVPTGTADTTILRYVQICEMKPLVLANIIPSLALFSWASVWLALPSRSSPSSALPTCAAAPTT